MRNYAVKCSQGYLAIQGNTLWFQDTPTGWALFGDESGARSALEANHSAIGTAPHEGGRVVAILNGREMETGTLAAMDAEDAPAEQSPEDRLRAAAPDLLAALKAMVQWTEDNSPGFSGDPEEEWCDQLGYARAAIARAAIARATGNA